MQQKVAQQFSRAGIDVSGSTSAVAPACEVAYLFRMSNNPEIKLNPRIVAGPIVLALADVFTLLFYFNIARWLL